jgi:alpha-beta hydrolase superfamily lysophospholipase
MMEEKSFRGDDGVEVFYRQWVPEGPARAVVVIVHGASEHSARYARFASVLNDEGYAVFAPDLRGHGRTASSTGTGRLGERGMDGVFADLDALVDLARAELPSAPIVLFGHSMGALVAQAYVERSGDRLAAFVLSGSGGVVEDVADVVALVQAAVDAGMADEPLDMLAEHNAGFEPARTTYDWLSRDDDEVDKYVADPWCGSDAPLTYGFVAGMVETVASIMEPDALAKIPKHLPVLLITGERDPVSNGAVQVRTLEQRLCDAGLDVTAHYYADARHELLNETNRDEVHADVTNWLARVLANA